MSAEFKRTFCTNVNVYFLGLWDCVASVGFIPRKLPFSKSPTNSVHYFRHAMALDEHRSKFKICQWQHQDPGLQRAQTFDATPKAQVKRGMKKSLRLLDRLKGRQHYLDGSIDVDEVNGIENHREGADWEDVDEQSKKGMEQEKLERYFESLDTSRKKHHKVETNALEVWFM
jgi:uncharacterized protein (DUF2235 family)